MRPVKISIVILNWNGKKDTLECLASLKEVNYPRFQAIVVDNGSTDGSVEAIRAVYPLTPILETKANLGFAGGNNVGIEWVLRHHADWILLLNNDTVVDPEFLNRFLETAQEFPRAKVLGAKILRYDDRDTVDHLGGMWNEAVGEFESLESGEKDHPYFNSKTVDYVCGAALFMHRSVPEAIGLLESRYFLFWEETDYCYRARKAGFEVRTAPEAKIWHKVSSSFVGGKPHMHYFWWRSRLLWMERNCTREERKALYRKFIWPELRKSLRHYLLKSAQNFFTRTKDPTRLQKAKRYKAGLAGAFDYFRKRFGNCPSWLLTKK